MKKALFYGILASFFFAFTFLLNRSMLAGEYPKVCVNLQTDVR